MYQTSSPIFDVPEFPALRRVKPLPKRRRTTLNLNANINVNLAPNSPVVTNSLLSSTSHPQPHPAAYIGSGFHSAAAAHQSQPRSQNHSQATTTTTTLNAASTTLVSSPLDVLQSHAGLDLGFPLPSPLNADSVTEAADTRTGTAARIDDGGGGGSDQGQLRQNQGHRQQQQQQLLMDPSVLSLPPSLPLPPTSPATEDGEHRSRVHSYPHSAYTHIYEHDHGREGERADSNGDEEADSEGTEGDLQERLFLREETDRLLAHADSLSAKMALQSYYRSMGWGAPEFGSNFSASPTPVSAPEMDQVTRDYGSVSNATVNLGAKEDVGGLSNTSSVNTGSGYSAVGLGRGQVDVVDGNGRRSTGDYADHSHQGQGNTKKRKVPANVGGSPPLHHHHHYSSHRGTQAAFGVGMGALGMVYGDGGEGEREERDIGFGFGFGLDLDVGGASVDGKSGLAVGGESDIFGPLPGLYSQSQHSLSSSASSQSPSQHRFHRKAKLSAATLVGLQRKELVRNRKKQLENLMGAVPAGDTWALDHVLSANFLPFISSSTSSSTSASPTNTDSDHGLALAVGARRGTGSAATKKPAGSGDSHGSWELGWGWSEGEVKEVKVRLSKRNKMRITRTARMGLGRLGRHPDAAPFPTKDFTVSCPSVTADRLVAIQEEVTNLRSLFGTEIAKQTAKAAKIAAENNNTGKGAGGGGGTGKGGKKRAQQRARTIMSAKSGEQPAEFLDMPQRGQSEALGKTQHASQQQVTQAPGQTPTPKKGKKKKRSALANASNPHHLRNYVPSRLPHSAGGGGGSHAQAGQNANLSLIGPLPLRFLSAELPPRRRGRMQGVEQTNAHVQPLPQLVVPQEEWICAFCEYSLFYGDEVEYRRAVKNRKKILRRRRRARERVAAAGSGVNAAMKSATGVVPASEKTRVEDEEEYDELGHEPLPASNVHSDGVGRVKAQEPPG